MADMEKVIRAWECCNPFNRKCKECPYEKDCYHDGVSMHMVADAIAMLKEQQPKKGYWKKPKNADARWHECSECGTMTRKVDEYGITLICNYCPICGADMH